MNSVIVAAAGKGVRLGASCAKPYVEIRGVPLLVRTVGRFEAIPAIDEIVVVVDPAGVDRATALLEKGGARAKVRAVVAGGARRQDSVREGLRAVSEEAAIVLVHDGARPFFSERSAVESIGAAEKTGGAIVAVPLSDTLKRVSGDRIIQETVPRGGLWRAQTPQTFRCSLLREAYEKAYADGFEATDDASVFERAGFPVAVVEGTSSNIKITTPEDVRMAEKFAEIFDTSGA